MKNLITIAIIFFMAPAVSMAQDTTNMISDTVEVSCGQCNFKMKGNGCATAVRIGEKTYFVKDDNIHDHGNAHGADGLCNVVRHAVVEGTIEKDLFVASKFKLLPMKKKKE